jgi:tetratricopeptide (TPR) repeat protein
LAAIEEGEAALRARLLARLACLPPHSHSMQQRDSLSREALALAKASGDTAALRDALAARSWACLGPDRIDDRLAVAAEFVALAEREGEPGLALPGREAAIGAQLLRGDLAAAERELAVYRRTASQLRQPVPLFIATLIEGSFELARGRFGEAERLFEAAFERGRGRVPYAHFTYTGQMFSLIAAHGNVDDARGRALADVFFGEMFEPPYTWHHAVRAALSLRSAVDGDLARARREFEAIAAEPGFARLERDEHWLITLQSLANAACFLGDRARGAELYELLRPYRELVVVHDLLRTTGNSVASLLARLATLQGRLDEAIGHGEAAIEIERAMGIRPPLLDTLYGHAIALRLRGSDRDRAQAKHIERHADAEAAELGVVGRADVARLYAQRLAQSRT